MTQRATGDASAFGVSPLKTVGHPTSRIDAVERVSGRAKYTNDVQLPGMLFAKVLRSPHPHARIVKVDTSAAERIPGVRAVLTGEDVRGRHVGKTLRDLRGAARNVGALADYLQRNPDALLFGARRPAQGGR